MINGVLLEGNREVAATHVDSWTEKLYRIEPGGDMSVLEHPAARAGAAAANKWPLGMVPTVMISSERRTSISVVPKPKISASFVGSSALGSSGKLKASFKRLGNLRSGDVVKCELLPLHLKPSRVDLTTGKAPSKKAGGAPAFIDYDLPGRVGICVLTFVSGAEICLCGGDEETAMRWLGCITSHMLKEADHPLGRGAGMLREGEVLGQRFFGRVAGESQTATRSALATEGATILILERTDYDSALAEERAAELHAVQHALVNMFGFGTLALSSDTMDKLCAVAERKVFKRGQNVFTAGAKATHLFFLIKGQCVLQRVLHTETHVRTYDGSPDNRHGAPSLNRGTRRGIASVSCSQAPSVLGVHAQVPGGGKAGGGEYGTHALGVTAIMDSEGFLLGLHDLEAIDSGEFQPGRVSLFSKVLSLVGAHSQMEKVPILSVSRMVEKTLWKREANLPRKEKDEAEDVRVEKDQEAERGRNLGYDELGEGRVLDAVARLGDVYK